MLYRISFVQHGTLTELLAKKMNHNPAMIGFVEVSDFVFIPESNLIHNPTFEKLKKEFENVNATYIPISNVVRIDYVSDPIHKHPEEDKGKKVVQLHGNA